MKVAVYICDLTKSPNPSFRTKLIVVGFSNVGKTTLLDCIFPVAGWLEVMGKKKKTSYWCKLQGSVFAKYDVENDPIPHKGRQTTIESHTWQVKTTMTESAIKSTYKLDVTPGAKLKAVLDEMKEMKIKDSKDPKDQKIKEFKDLNLHCPDLATCRVWDTRFRRVCLNESTHGIDIQSPKIDRADLNGFMAQKIAQIQGGQTPPPGQEKTGPVFEMSVWDFAGQNDYYNNHHYFLSVRSIFLVLWKMSEGAEGLKGLEFWFKSLAARLPETAPDQKTYSVIVVGTHLDHPSVLPEKFVDRKSAVVSLAKSSGLQAQIQVMEVSCLTLENIDLLQNTIFHAAMTHSYMGNPVPDGYLQISKLLAKVREERLSNNELPVVEVKDLALWAGYDEKALLQLLDDEPLVKRALSFLSLWGECLYFDSPPELSNIVIVDPKFLAKGILADLFKADDHTRSQTRNGIVPHERLQFIWKKFATPANPRSSEDSTPPNLTEDREDRFVTLGRGPKNDADFSHVAASFMMLLEKLGVCFVMPETPEKPFMNQRSIIPALLPDKAEDDSIRGLRPFAEEWTVDPPWDKQIEVERVLKFNVIPAEVISQLLVHLHRFIWNGNVWRNDVLLSLPEYDALAWISADLTSNTFTVAIRGKAVSKCEAALQFISTKIKEVVGPAGQKYAALSIQEMVRSPYSLGALIPLEEVKADAARPHDQRTLVCPQTHLAIWAERLLLRAGLLEQEVLRPAPQPWWKFDPDRKMAILSVVLENGAIKDSNLLAKCSSLVAHAGGEPERLKKVYAISNQGLFSSFEFKRSKINSQHKFNKNIFMKSTWMTRSDSAQRSLFMRRLASKMTHFKNEFSNTGDSPFVVPAVMGTSEGGALNMAETGCSIVASLDEGYYGKGIYVTSDIDYALLYARQPAVRDGSKILILGVALPGNAYPVTEPPFLITRDEKTLQQLKTTNPNGFLGKPFQNGYQSHYTVVESEKVSTAFPTSRPDFETGSQKTADELVLFETDQFLPLFIVYYDLMSKSSTGLHPRTVSSVDSEEIPEFRRASEAGSGNLLERLLATYPGPQ